MDNEQRWRVLAHYDRVREHSPASVNERIDHDIQASVARHVTQGRYAVIRRIAELELEWDIDRALMLNFAFVGGTALAIGSGGFVPWWARRRARGALGFLGIQIGFLLMHATAGWCPPVAVLRRLGVRTKSEIESERAALLVALTAEPSLQPGSQAKTENGVRAQNGN